MVLNNPNTDLPAELREQGVRKCITIGIATSMGLPIDLVRTNDVDESDDIRNWALEFRLGDGLAPMRFDLSVLVALSASTLMDIDKRANGRKCESIEAMKVIMDLVVPLLRHLYPGQPIEDGNPIENYKRIKEFFANVNDRED